MVLKDKCKEHDYIEFIANVLKFNNEIMELNKEIERLNNDIKILLKENENKEKVILKYDNIINELEKWLEEQIKICQAHDNEFGVNVCNTFKNKLKKLKGDSSNE